LLDCAKAVVRDPAYAWPATVSQPDAHPAEDSREEKINNLFLGACAWCVLHEIAHVALGHQGTNPTHRLLQQEFEADDWATKWLLEKCTDPKQREFRILSCAVGLAWVGIVDSLRRGNNDHPHASERLMKCAEHFGASDLSPALEIATHFLKVFFSPGDSLRW
jgi:hypothetical protein